MRARANDLRGIVNGIDYDVFNPETDPDIVQNYNAKNFRKEKVKNNFTKDTYTLYNNNCQNFVNTVISVAKYIAESNKESLYLEN